VKKFTSYIFAAAAFLTSTAFAGDDHPHRTITISGECRSCELARENLYGAEILGALFVEANFDDANLNNSVIIETQFLESDLNRTDFSNSRLSGVVFRGSALNGAIFSGSHGERVGFDGADLSQSDLSRAMMILANFNASNLSNANLTEGQFYNARFNGATLNGTNFMAALLPGAVFRNSTGQGVIFVNSDLRGADFSGAELVEADFEGAVLHGARFEGTILIDVRGLSAESLTGACRNAQSQLPETIELMECSERPSTTGPQGNSQTTIQFSVRQGSIEQPNGAVTQRTDNTIRLDLIRNEQMRVVMEFEAAREALANTRELLVETQTQINSAESVMQEALLAETEEQMQSTIEIETQLSEQRHALVEQILSNPELLRAVRGSGERLIFVDDPRGQFSGPGRAPSIVVDGNRYQLNGRYQWVLDMPVPPPPPDVEGVFIETPGPKGPGELLTPSEDD